MLKINYQNYPNKKCYAENKMKRMVFIENGCSATVIHRTGIWKKNNPY